MFYLWKQIGQTRGRGYSRKRRSYPTVTATVEIVGRTEKVILLETDQGKTAWIPRYWVLKKKEIGEHNWQIEIKRHQWEEKFPGKSKESLSPRSRH